ncbi:hypothetical protein GBA52_002939, partial [Prunus armeniaca]
MYMSNRNRNRNRNRIKKQTSKPSNSTISPPPPPKKERTHKNKKILACTHKNYNNIHEPRQVFSPMRPDHVSLICVKTCGHVEHYWTMRKLFNHSLIATHTFRTSK